MAGPAASTNPRWRKSTYSAESNCIELAALATDDVVIRNSTTGDVVISCSREDFRAFVQGVKAGEFDDLA